MFPRTQLWSIAVTCISLCSLLFVSQPAAAVAPVSGLSRQTIGSGNLGFVAEVMGERIHPNILSNAKIDTAGFEAAVGQLSAVQEDLTEERAAGARLSSQLDSLRPVEKKLTDDVGEAFLEFADASEEDSQASQDLRSFAIASFKQPAQPMWMEVVATGSVSSDLGLRRQVEADLADSQKKLRAQAQTKEAAFDHLRARLVAVTSEIDVAESSLATTEVRIARLASEAERLGDQLVSAVLLAPVQGLQFPVVVLDSYYRAQLSTAAVNPRCQVSWNQLAAIGKVESGHGTFGGKSVGDDGRTSEPILGPELNGARFAAIRDTDGGRLDNNPVWDHAVGPMQFIPSSWQRHGADGNGDEVSDPHNMYDAALAAASHLCASRSQLGSPENFTAALFGYNRSTSYGAQVKSQAATYAAALNLR